MEHEDVAGMAGIEDENVAVTADVDSDRSVIMVTDVMRVGPRRKVLT